MLFLDQDVVGVEGGNGEYRYAALGQGIEERGQDSGQRKCERAFQLEAGPRRFTFCILRSVVRGADDGEFFGGSRDRDEAAVPVSEGIGASGGKRQTAKVAGRRRNFSCMRIAFQNLAELRSAWTGRRPVPTQFQVPTAFLTAALASSRVESRVGSGEESGVTRSGISVQPRTTASQP